MKHLTEKISVFNLICFIAMSIGHFFNYAFLWHISAVGVLLSLGASVYLLYSSKQIKEQEMRKRQTLNSIKLLIFCLFFLSMYAFKFF